MDTARHLSTPDADELAETDRSAVDRRHRPVGL